MSVKRNESIVNENKNKVEKKMQKKDDYGENFIPPDGGWGWVIVIAAGFSNFCIFPVLQSFGLIFRDRFAELGINSSQTATILNINLTVTSCIGLANGPLFRKFSYRQVAFVGALICAISITILSTITTFTGCLIFFSILYGAGIGITMSSNALALNTYFKVKRRIAVGLSWTCTGIGPIVMPQIITQLIPMYGVKGTVLIFGGFAFNAVACALLLQSVFWHVKREKSKNKLNNNINVESQGSPMSDQEIKEQSHQNRNNVSESKSLEDIERNTRSNLSLSKGKFGSQYLYYDDEEDGPSGIDVIEPGTPMMSRANDGWFSRRYTSTPSMLTKASKKEDSFKNSNLSISLSAGSSVKNLTRQSSETEKNRRRILNHQQSNGPLIILNESNEHSEDFEQSKDPNYNNKLEQKPMITEEDETDQLLEKECTEEKRKKTFLETLIIFFDLDLLRDLVYVNILLGMTFATFSELNFSLLTPFILSEYGYSKIQIATYMSILGGVDVGTRLIIPFVADFIGWQNRTFFLVGVCGMAVGRIVLAHVHNFQVALAVAILLGIGKALRTIFVALVIASHVPLSRLPGATGIQLLTSGIVYLTLGPIIGWIRDITSDYVIMLHFLNILTYFTMVSWLLEIYFTRRKSKKSMKNKEATDELNDSYELCHKNDN